MMPNMQQAMKQVKKMQADMARVQEELAGKTVTATAGGGDNRETGGPFARD
jgi:DNA-binding protein YbaB